MLYTIKAGDNLTNIAKKYNTTITAIVKANPSKIKDPNKITAGEKIEIPVKISENSNNSKNYTEIGKQVEKCLNDIEKLDSFKKLSKML